jgi:hypothetical protein
MTGHGEVPTRNSPMMLRSLLPAKAGSRDREIDSPTRGVPGCFLDIWTNPDEVDCPTLSDDRTLEHSMLSGE